MLAEQELRRLTALIDGAEQPTSGLEKHFLRVIRGDAIPCSPKEREWLQAILLVQGARRESGAHVSQDAEIEALRSEIANRAAVIADLQKELKRLAGINDSRDQLIHQLDAKVSMLEGHLNKCHEALAKYEKVPPPVVTDVEKDNKKLLRRARLPGQCMVVYSSTTGQD